MPALGSDRVYVVDVKTDPRKPRLDKVMLMLMLKLKLVLILVQVLMLKLMLPSIILLMIIHITHIHSQVIEPWELHALGVGTPHTTHCLADGNVMISTLR